MGRARLRNVVVTQRGGVVGKPKNRYTGRTIWKKTNSLPRQKKRNYDRQKRMTRHKIQNKRRELAKVQRNKKQRVGKTTAFAWKLT